jgi:hypothetical protein
MFGSSQLGLGPVQTKITQRPPEDRVSPFAKEVGARLEEVFTHSDKLTPLSGKKNSNAH